MRRKTRIEQHLHSSPQRPEDRVRARAAWRRLLANEATSSFRRLLDESSAAGLRDVLRVADVLRAAFARVKADGTTPEHGYDVVTGLWQKAHNGKFDVFLCHNSVDKRAVRRVAEELRLRGILPWLDEEQLRPGLPWQRAIEKQIRGIRAAAVFVGRNGRGPWQDMEIDAFLRQFVRRGCPVIPVLLRGCERRPSVPAFLEGFTWVDFRKQTPAALDQLIFGITGVRTPSRRHRI